MEKSIDATDQYVSFVVENAPGGKRTRDQVVLDSQVWPFAWSEEGKALAIKSKLQDSMGEFMKWLATNYPWQTNNDPIPSWRSRLESLRWERDKHVALKKYCDFMKQTEELRGKIEEEAGLLENELEAERKRSAKRGPSRERPDPK